MSEGYPASPIWVLLHAGQIDAVPPAGFEPAHPAPEAGALSPELRGRRGQCISRRRFQIWLLRLTHSTIRPVASLISAADSAQ